MIGGVVAIPKAVAPQSLTSRREKIGHKVISHGRYVSLQRADVPVSRRTFAGILSLIARLQASPAPT